MKLEEIPIDTLTDIFIEQYTIDQLREQGYSFDVYFDSHDIYSMIQGFWSLENNKGKIRQEKIEIDDLSFVLRGMAYFGKIRNLKVFKPHMLEITRLLDRDHCFPVREIPEYLINNLFQTLQLEHPNVFKVNRNSKDSRIQRHLQRLIKKSKNLFKAYYILIEPKWTARANYLLIHENAIIQKDVKTYELLALSETEMFMRLKDEFNARRGDKTGNNLRDALSLCMLLSTLKQNDSKTIPLFLASSERIKAISQDERFKSDFSVSIDGKKINLLKTTEFFLFDVIFSDYEDSSGPMFLKLNELKIKRRLFGEMNWGEELIESIKKDIASFVDQEFYEILGSINKDDFDFDQSISKLNEFQEAIRTTQFKENFEKEKDTIVSQLKKYASDLQIFEDIWSALEKIERIELNETLLEEGPQVDIFRDTGLTRFSPPQGFVERNLKQIWETLLYERTTTNDHYLKAQQQIVHYLFTGLQDKNTDYLTVGCSLLWVFESYEIIDRILCGLDFKYNSLTLATIHASCVCMSNSRDKRQIVDKIIRSIAADPVLYGNDYKEWMALSYINFRVWESEETPHFIIDRTERAFQSKFYYYAVNAIDLADKAYQWLDSRRNEEPTEIEYRNVKFFYLANIYIYYVSRAGDRKHFLGNELETRVQVLEQALSNNSRYWQSTFYHTLSTYFIRKYDLATDLEKKKFFLDKADEYYRNFTKSALFVTNRLKALGNLIEREKYR